MFNRTLSAAALPAQAPVLAVVIPIYRSAATLGAVVGAIAPDIRHIIAVDDGSPDDPGAALAAVGDPRVILLRHPHNRGVGAAMKTGFAKALELGADIIVKLDSDGQMDPRLISKLLAPILSGAADFTKGNRFLDLALVRRMPLPRRLGNLALSFLVKLASGYWSLFDPCNGFLALRADLLRAVRFPRLAERYFFEISLLCESYHARAVVRDVPMAPVYGDEPSSLRPVAVLFEFAPRLLARAAARFGTTYFLRDFTVVSLFLLSGLPLAAFGVVWSAYYWYRSLATGVATVTGTIIVGTLTIVLGFQLLLQALVLDVQSEPGRRGRD